jgi:uncharacterized protein (DUF2336 family)
LRVDAAETAEIEEPEAADPEQPAVSRARVALFKRLADVVCLPASRVNVFERSVTADLLVDMLREAPVEDRLRVARRLCGLTEIPPSLIRLLLRDQIEVAQPLLETCAALSDVDLVDCARNAGMEHRRLIAGRRGVGELVSEAVVEPMEPGAVELLLRNGEAKVSNAAIERIVAATRTSPRFASLLLRRPELRPHHAYVMFWWADAEVRKLILQRFAVSREVLQEATSDVFALAAEEGWSDPISRKALQFIERRQRNRQALARSRFASLEEAVTAAGEGMSREIAEEISYLSGLKPMTGAKILTDPGGEPMAILCKATGLPRDAVRDLWRALRRSETDSAGRPSPALERVLIAYDTIAVDRAQTVLRYWNWALSSALTPALLRAIREGDEDAVDDYSAPQRAAMLVLQTDLTR